MNERVPCMVLGCRCTRKPHADLGEEWICAKHWRSVPRWRRRELSRIARAYRRQFGDQGYWKFPPGSEKRIAAIDMDTAWRAVWEQCKIDAQDAALGI